MCKTWSSIFSLLLMLTIGFAGSVQAYPVEVTYTVDGIDLDTGAVEHDPTMLWLLMGDIIDEDKILRPSGIPYPDAPPDFSSVVDVSFEFEFDSLADIQLMLHNSVKIAMVEDGTSFELVGADVLDDLTFLDGPRIAIDNDIILIALTADDHYFKLGLFEHQADLLLTLHVEEILPQEPSIIPEPSTLLLVGLGMLGLIGLVRVRCRLGLFLMLVLLASLAGAQPLYAQGQDKIIIQKVGCGKGTVLAGDQECGSSCNQDLSIQYVEGRAVLLKAEPADGSVFIRWERFEKENSEWIPVTRSFKPQQDDTIRAMFAAPKSYTTTDSPLVDLDLNRKATWLDYDALQTKGFHDAHTGFMWKSGDNTTTNWRPQGIAGIGTVGPEEKKRNFLAVSWNGKNGYEHRGVRISFVDVTKMNEAINYRHVLLVDKNYHTFEGMTGGGLVFREGKLHVPDTRNGVKQVHVFSIDSIQEVPPCDRASFYNYRYILKQESSYDVPVTPSFLSYDRDRAQVLTGTFSRDTPRKLAWYDIDNAGGSSLSCGPFFEKMQGAASANDPMLGGSALWVASSNKSNEQSHLHIENVDVDVDVDVDVGLCSDGVGLCCDNVKRTNAREIIYPPGLQDMHISTSDNIWMHTAFGPDEGSGNNRVVFATKKDILMPYNATLSLGALDSETGLNRTATKLSSESLQTKGFHDAHTGFVWNDGDNETTDWRPQGITEIEGPAESEDPVTRYHKRFLAVSWYGKSNEYKNRGARISFVDITNMYDIKYRHVLLVDKDGNTFEGMHAGGLVYKDRKLHVPDTRLSEKVDGHYQVHVFSIDSIKKVPVKKGPPFYKYAYILPLESSYDAPITPSFMSYDWSRKEMLVGRFNYCCTTENCKNDDGWPKDGSDDPDKSDNPDSCKDTDIYKNSLAWYTIDPVNTLSQCDGNFFYEMQGAVSDDNEDGNMLWAATSFGKDNKSYLHIATLDDSDRCSYNKNESIPYPPGLEDMHISQSGDIWMLTEFAHGVGSYDYGHNNDGTSVTIENNRIVFATKKEMLMP